MLSPPTILEQLDAEPGGHEELRKLDFVLSAGGPLGPAAGNSISQVTRLGQFIGFWNHSVLLSKHGDLGLF